jgi:GNAT superfamily N-acetyltransferase
LASKKPVTRCSYGWLSGRTVMRVDPLDLPIWSALTTDHAALALGDGLARRYPAEMSPLAATRDGSPQAFADLRELVAPDGRVGLFTPAPLDVPGDWIVVGERWIDQMVCDAPAPAPPVGGPELVELGEGDVPEMLALTSATQPGPFAARTVEMGRYLGVRSDAGRLVAMAGERLRAAGATEISAVCTDPAFTGRGYARALMVPLMAKAVAEGQLPILHVKTDNGAKHLYEKLGFRVRRPIRLTLLRRPR